jgi:hypothetical protein
MGKCSSQLNILSEKIARLCNPTTGVLSMTKQMTPLRRRMIDDMRQSDTRPALCTHAFMDTALICATSGAAQRPPAPDVA